MRAHLRHEVRELQQRLGVTTIMVTHDQEEALTMADRIVVMNHGVINQVGSPLTVYREPATPFAAHFVGKANTLDAVVEAPGLLRIGERAVACVGATGPAGRAVRLFLRPEDVVPSWMAAPTDELVDSIIEKVDFHGSYCLASIAIPGLGQPLTMFLTLNSVGDRGLRGGSPLQVRILGDRIRVFGP